MREIQKPRSRGLEKISKKKSKKSLTNKTNCDILKSSKGRKTQ